MNLVEQFHQTEGECISNVFMRAKNNGDHRFILNLKSLNTSVTFKHFKMDSMQTAILLMMKGVGSDRLI